ncbi:hypothetical protein ACHWQZ_G016938 [Mnemiopsis leidyi]
MTRVVPTKIKCVMIGDSNVGKTTIFQACLLNSEQEAGGDVCDSGVAELTVDNIPYEITLYDTSGRESDIPLISSLTFPRTNVFVLCYSVISPRSLENVEKVWLKQIAKHRKKAVTVLLGLRTDQRLDKTQNIVTYYQAKDFAEKHNLSGFTECCAFDSIRTEILKQFIVKCHTGKEKDQCCIQ